MFILDDCIGKCFTIFFFLIVGEFSFCQLPFSPYSSGFKVGFEEGYCYGTAKGLCLIPLTPLPPLPPIEIGENGDNFHSGYKRGFQIGLDFHRTESGVEFSIDPLRMPKLPSFNSYTPQFPVDDYIKIGMYLQMKYDTRVNWIQRKINSIHDVNYCLIYPHNKEKYEEIREDIITWLKRNLEGKKIDYAKDQIFNQIVHFFEQEEKYIIDVYKFYISK